jgi:hypothetical protein
MHNAFAAALPGIVLVLVFVLVLLLVHMLGLVRAEQEHEHEQECEGTMGPAATPLRPRCAQDRRYAQ